MVIGLILSTASYVVAENLIDSKDVIYEDNSNLVANNVQDAIDGTCSKIDTRLSDIEDKLYTVKNLAISRGYEPTTNELAYTGVSITLPAKSYCSITGGAGYYSHIPLRVSLNSNSTSSNSTLSYSDYSSPQVTDGASINSTTYSVYTENAMTIYLWVKYSYNVNPASKLESLYITGFCATKYK